MEVKTKILENSIGRGWGCGYVIIPKEHPFMVKLLLNEETPFYPQIKNFTEEITFAEWENENYFTIGFDTSHGWNNKENSSKSFVIEKTNSLKNCIDSYTMEDAKEEVRNHLENIKIKFNKYL